MKAIILAAGRGSRMGNLTSEHPKCLTKLQGKSLLQWQIDTLHAAGIQDIALVTGYKEELIQHYVPTIFHNPRWDQSNMVASLLCAKAWLDTTDCIISYSDIYYSPRIIQDLSSTPDDIAIAYDPNWLTLWEKRFANPLDDAETFTLNNQHYVTDIGNKADSIQAIQGQYMGLLKFKQSTYTACLAKKSTDDIKKLDMTGLLNELVAQNLPIKAIPNHEQWMEFDTAHDVAVFNALATQ